MDEKVFLLRVGSNIKKFRKKMGLTQSDLAAEYKDEFISKQTISKMENGKRNLTLTTILKLANALDVAPKDLLDVTKD
jgi:transcriptional regulator with XRE-family HTH domain